MAFDTRRDAQLRRRVERSAEQRIRGHDTGHGRRCGRPETAAHGDLIAHLDAPADPFGQFTASRTHRGLQPSDEPVIAILGELAATLTVDRQLDLTAAPATHLDLDAIDHPQRDAEAIEPGPEVGR